MSALNATVSALQYGLPLLSYAKLASPFVAFGAVNYFVHLTQLATPKETTVVLPNVDTIYSAAVFDLSKDDVNVTIPSIDAGRYWSFAFYDPFGNNFATPSSVQSSPAGDYLLRYVPNRAEWGLQSSEESNSSFPYQGYINSPTTDGVFLGRILVKNNSTDLKHVQSLVEASKIATVPSNRMEAMSLTKESLEPYQSSNNTARTVLQLLANFHDTNRPFNVSSQDQHHLRAELAKAGIRNGTYHQPSNLNLTEAYELAMKSIQTSSKSVTQPFNNGWSRNVPQGLFGDHYLDRAVTAGAGYLEQTSDQALYPMRAHKTMNLNANESYLYTFSGKPPLKDGGFWSLTLYNSAGYLTENSLNRYALGDRSNLTYSDGTAVYGAHSDDKPFQVLIQRGDVAPLSNWTNNWLPAPANSSNFSATLRFFAPKPELVNAAYEYPIVVKEAAK